MRCSCHWTTYAEGAKAAEDALLDVFGVREARKDDRNFLTRRGFESVLRGVTRDLILITKPHDQAALRACLTALDNNWRGMSPAAIEEAIDRAAKALGGVPRVMVGQVVQALAKAGQQVVSGTKQAAQGMYDLPINPSFNLVDERVTKHAAESQAFYVRDEYGKRQDAASAQARAIVSQGLEEGLDRYDIGKRLSPVMQMIGVFRSEFYYENVVSIFTARSRTWGILSSFEEAGIETFEISATLDEMSCDICRLMNGKTFSVGSAKQRFERVAASEDPEAVKDLQPFMGLMQNEQGEQAVYFKRGGQKVPVAMVDKPAFGQLDTLGTYSRVMGRGAMEANGISAPPYHGRCRCLATPV